MVRWPFQGVGPQGGGGLDHQPVLPLADDQPHPVGGTVVQTDQLDLVVGGHLIHLVAQDPDLQNLRVLGGLQHRVGQGGALAVQDQIETFFHQASPFSSGARAACSAWAARAARSRRALSGSLGSKFKK